AAAVCGVGPAVWFPQTMARDSVIAGALLRAVDCVEAAAEPLARDEAVASAFAALALRHGGADQPAGVARPMEPRGVARARARLDDAPAEPLDLPALAALADLSPYALIRAFKRETGMTPGAYLRARRVTLAQQALRQGETCAAVAADLGFADQAHMTRAFKGIIGVTPGVYRALWRAAA
ncbi:MAG: helix-turn-helix transcriptional regulator, partial [Pseudomonadota bacterium]